MSELAQNTALWVGLTLLLGAVVHFGLVLAIPYVVGIRLRSMAERNTIVHGAKPTADFNPIRRSSPDLIYSVCPYDLSEGPLHITAPIPGTYMSVSCFALNTDNFYVKNDRQVEDWFDFVLIGPSMPEPEAPGSDIVRSPTRTGGILFRYFVGDGACEDRVDSIRREIRIVRHVQDDESGERC
jgi:uncharacterized membrane protein